MIGQTPKALFFKNREEIAKDLMLPPFSLARNYVIIPPNSFGTGFKQIAFKKYSSFFEGQVDKVEVKKLITSFNTNFSYVIKEHKRYCRDNGEGTGWFYSLLFYLNLFCLLASFAIFVYVVMYNSQYQHRYYALTIVAFGLSVALVNSLLLTLMSCKSLDPFQTLTENLEYKLTKLLKYQNEKMKKKGFEIVPGKKFLWLEVWKIKAKPYRQPFISLMGREPIYDYDLDNIAELLFEKKKELEETYRKRTNIKAKKLEYLRPFYKEKLKLQTQRQE